MVIGCSPAWPNPGGACSGYLVEDRLLLDCGPGVLAKLRQRQPWPTVEAIAITHLHLDHWGDLVPWVWGGLSVPASRCRSRSSGCRRGRGSSSGRSSRCSVAKTCSTVPSTSPSTRPAGRSPRRPASRSPPSRSPLRDPGLRLPHQGRPRLAYSGDSGPSTRSRSRARRRPAPLRGDARERRLRRPDRGHLSPEEVVGAAADARALRVVLTHRPFERRRRPGVELAHDGLELEF